MVKRTVLEKSHLTDHHLNMLKDRSIIWSSGDRMGLTDRFANMLIQNIETLTDIAEGRDELLKIALTYSLVDVLQPIRSKELTTCCNILLSLLQ